MNLGVVFGRCTQHFMVLRHTLIRPTECCHATVRQRRGIAKRMTVAFVKYPLGRQITNRLRVAVVHRIAIITAAAA